MTRGRRGPLFALAGIALGALAALPAHADTPPTRWDRARDPSLSESYRLHVEVHRRLVLGDRPRIDLEDAGARGALALLERYHAERSKDPVLRFDLGTVYLTIREYDKAAKALTSALADFPNHPAAEEGWLRLAQACGHTADHDCERRAYTQVLNRQTEEVFRGTPTLNLAETEMHFGNLREAIEGYREALRISGRVPSGIVPPLAVWGVAVALDRSGDPIGAEKEARFGHTLLRSMGRPNLLHDPNEVYFTPDYEVHWYDGLGFIAQAREATTPSERVRLWRAAERSFASYVRGGEPAKDRWLEIAKVRLATAKAEREKAEKKYGKEPRREAEDDEREMSP
jgi:tetratricopeptide (TPR) repeat protein